MKDIFISIVYCQAALNEGYVFPLERNPALEAWLKRMMASNHWQSLKEAIEKMFTKCSQNVQTFIDQK